MGRALSDANAALPLPLWGVMVAAAVGACTGMIEQPSGSAPCFGDNCPAVDDPGGPGGPGAPGDPSDPNDPSDPERPDGVGDPASPDGVGWSTRFPKLSNQQWESTVTDLLRLDQPTGLAAAFTQEALDNNYVTGAAAELTVGGDAWARYQTAAEQAADLVVADDAKLNRLLPQGDFADTNARGDAFITAFGRRAYRRPLTPDEASAYRALFRRGPELVGGDALKAGVRLVIEAMLQSPHFLYRVESVFADGGASDRKAWLSGYEVATRLSYALWGTMPSDALLDAAEDGTLGDAEGVARWARELLDDPRAQEMLRSFHEQTFSIAAYGTQDKDPSLGFDAAALAPVMRDEARRFFDEVIVQGQGGIAQLLTEPVAFVNAETAPFYGLSGIQGDGLQRAALDPAERAGLLMQLGFLTKNATRSGSDPVHRGLLVLRKVLCDEPDPPPMMFELPSAEAGLTTREVYEKATACGRGCHDTLINPPGFAFESFDAIGRVRTMEAGKPVDTSGALTVRAGYSPAEKRENPSHELVFDDAVDMVTQLSSEPRVHECYARNWLEYTLAREPDPIERGAWELLRDGSLEHGSAQELIVALVQLDTFRSRVSE